MTKAQAKGKPIASSARPAGKDTCSGSVLTVEERDGHGMKTLIVQR